MTKSTYYAKKTPVSLYHSTGGDTAAKIKQSGKIKGSNKDTNDACRKLGLTKIWTCAVPFLESCCDNHGEERFEITASDLRRVSDNWDVYMTMNDDGFRYKGRHRVFYNFFLVPSDLPLPKKSMKKLMRADIEDWYSDKVQFFWNDGAMYILERSPGEFESDSDSDDDVTTFSTDGDEYDSEVNPDNELRSFHVAIVSWHLRPDSAAESDECYF